MASINTRDAVAQHELQSNALVQALATGGSLHSSGPEGPFQAFLLPRQISLQAIHLDAVLKLRESDIRHDRLMPEPPSSDSASPVSPLRRQLEDVDSPLPSTLSMNQFHDLMAILANFLLYHLVHFDGDANSRFTTAKGHRGVFSESLDSVKRFDHGGAVQVVTDANPIFSATDPRVPEYHPLKLPIFIIDRPLMDKDEIASLRADINRALSPVRKDASPADSRASRPFSAEFDIIVEEDLTPFESKNTRQSEHNRRSQHVNLITHVYSRESVQDYRKAVAMDNEIHYTVFEELIGSPPCENLVRLISMYVESVQRGDMSALNSDKYKAFRMQCTTEIEGVVRRLKTNHRVILQEGIEKYVMTKLYLKVFRGVSRHSEINQRLQERWSTSSYFSPLELDALPEIELHHVWGQAMFELDAMNFFKSPRDKLRCGMRACELLSLAVGDILLERKQQLAAASSGGQPSASASPPPQRESSGPVLAFGADEFIPCFILLVLRGQPFNFQPNISYIETYRDPDSMSPEECYTLATMQSALTFWLTCDSEGRIAEPPAASASPNKGAPGRANKYRSAMIAASTTATGRASSLSSSTLNMRQEDLLPSIQRSSSYLRTAATATNRLPKTSTAGTAADPTGAAAAPSIMDTLFGWANPKAAASSAGSSPLMQGKTVAGPFLERWSSSAKRPIGGTLHAQHPPEQTGSADVVTAVALPNASQLPSSSVIRSLLGDQAKAFEDLSVSELRDIVEEARLLVRH